MQAEFRFIFSEAFLLTSLLRYRRQVWWRRPFVDFKWPLAAALCCALVFAILKGYSLLASISGGGLGMLLVGWPIDAWFARWNFRKSPFCNAEMHFSVSASGCHILGKSSEVRLDWQVFTKARRFADGLLLFQGPRVVNWLPDSAAADAVSIENARQLARVHIADYRELS